MSSYDGSWENDPLDMRCIRLDAENEAGQYYHEDVWTPQTLEDCYKPEFKDYTICASTPPERFLKKFIHCFILDSKDNIVERHCHDPYHAKQVILEKYDETHKILITGTLEFMSLEGAEEYE